MSVIFYSSLSPVVLGNQLTKPVDAKSFYYPYPADLTISVYRRREFSTGAPQALFASCGVGDAVGDRLLGGSVGASVPLLQL